MICLFHPGPSGNSVRMEKAQVYSGFSPSFQCLFYHFSSFPPPFSKSFTVFTSNFHPKKPRSCPEFSIFELAQLLQLSGAGPWPQPAGQPCAAAGSSCWRVRLAVCRSASPQCPGNPFCLNPLSAYVTRRHNQGSRSG